MPFDKSAGEVLDNFPELLFGKMGLFFLPRGDLKAEWINIWLVGNLFKLKIKLHWLDRLFGRGQKCSSPFRRTSYWWVCGRGCKYIWCWGGVQAVCASVNLSCWSKWMRWANRATSRQCWSRVGSGGMSRNSSLEFCIPKVCVSSAQKYYYRCPF